MTQDPTRPSRRAAFVAAGGALAAGLALAGCGGGKTDEKPKAGGGADPADEALIRGHAVLRRLLVIYRELGGRLAGGAAGFDAAALGQAADLFRAYGEDYLERELQEQHVFPALQKLGGPVATLVPVLLAQHGRGREITAYVRERCAGGRIAAADAMPLARALQDFARMYEAHAAYEDTVVFPAWRQGQSAPQWATIGAQFAQIEHSHFAGGAFEMAAGQAAQIEQKLGLADLARYTAQPVG